MNNWWRIGAPILMAVLLITATVGITLAVTARSSSGQAAAPATLPVQGTSTQYVSAPFCPNCPGYVHSSTASSQDDSTGNTDVSQGATCPNCPGYTAAAVGQPATAVRGGCCGSR
jgi:ABC-type multidrug transport system permease subunit